ncbi:PD-(D/E)XK nuclease family protein [Methylorubrum extorquens]|uniref:PD-(D/E)XK nuclease family protein n=1 Tax=Methylorubrum extorquens TaxID=408 RepID=UPI0005C15BBC|nr:PD-(D/E)XK nuclease family protein [Methylorubrum extorquens]MCP1546273.1 hypothetical protein [Methylorubrum extorquens]MCP1590940.1 hypothetical protein [Methylorubrum extorquens]
MVSRRAVVVQGRLATADARLGAARRGEHGVRVLSIDALVARLAGGFARPVDEETLKSTLKAVLPETELGELDPIKALPGMIDAAAETLRKAWSAGFDLQAAASRGDRVASIAHLEQVVVAALPPGMLRPGDLAAAAAARIDHAPAILGPVEFVDLPDLAPCWHPVVVALAQRVAVTWASGPRPVPEWIAATAVRVVSSEPEAPVVEVCSAATPRHEVLEALRWARGLMASGRAKPSEIAIAACRTEEYDDVVLALRAEAHLDVRFVHGVPSASVREGQAAAALADVLVRGLSQDGIRRLAALLRQGPGPFGALPPGWTGMLPREAPLTNLAAWERLLAGRDVLTRPDGPAVAKDLRAILALLARGTSAAAEAGETLLHGLSLRIWRKALLEGSPAVVDLTLSHQRIDDDADAGTSVVWAPASALACAPRRFVRLLGLSSRGWPQVVSEDRLLSDHLVPSRILDPLPRSVSDRGDFAAILSTSSEAVVLSRPRRGADGRLLGKSPLLRGHPDGTHLGRNRVPEHAVGEIDRLMARPEEFRATAQATAAASCWRAWAGAELTAHDGRIRPNHPVVVSVLGRVHSARSLRKLLRDPLGFVWRYGLGLETADPSEETLTLDHRAFGSLMHEALEATVGALEAGGGFAAAPADRRRAALAAAVASVAAAWERERPVPPALVWRRTLEEVTGISLAALSHPDAAYAGQTTWVEVPFGGQAPKRDGTAVPWDHGLPVEIPGTDIRISGFIDRLDLSECRSEARVRDYKTEKPRKPTDVLAGGRELQRCLYGYAARVLLGPGVSVDASLHYPREGICLPLEQPDTALGDLARHLAAAGDSLRAGNAHPGPDAEDAYNDLSFALPANAGELYCPRKRDAVRAVLGEAAGIWEAA